MERLLAWFFEVLAWCSGVKTPLPSTTTPNPVPVKVNDHIYELYKPLEEPSMDILFFHGLQFGQSADAYWSTWTCGSENGDASEQIWPSTWLVEKFPNAHIFSMSYDSYIRKTRDQGRFDLHNVAENMIQAIVWADIGQGLDRPVILVGHCFGGLVIKELCIQAHHNYRKSSNDEKIERFLQNVGGLFFYGTPHRGSSSLDTASSLFGGLLLDYVKVLSEKTARLEEDFANVCKKYDIEHIASVGELHPTSWKLFCEVVVLFCEVIVPEASARYGNHCTVAADHFTICKPAERTSNSFKHLITFLQDVQPRGRTPGEDEDAWWTRLGKLDLERALRTAGASATSINEVRNLVDLTDEEISSKVLAIMARKLDLKHGKCLLLAILGRGVESHITKLNLAMEGDRYDLRENEARALCLNLASNTNLRWVDLNQQKVYGTPHGCTLVSNALKTNANLTDLCLPFTFMGPEAVKILMDGVKENTTLERLDIGCNPLGDAGISCVAEMLSSNIDLKFLQLHGTSCGFAGVKRIASALAENTSLQKFTIGANPFEEEGMKILLRPFIQDGAGQKNTTLRDLIFGDMNHAHFSVSSLASMIRTNKSLSALHIAGVKLYPEHWVEQIIPALRENNTLKSLNISECGGLTVPLVFDALMDLITSSSTGLEEIVLHQTDMSVKERQINEGLRVNKEYPSGLSCHHEVG